MSEDDDVLRYVFNAPPPSYQFHRYTDWIVPFLTKQKLTIEKDGVPQYYQSRYKNACEALELWEKEIQEKVDKLTAETNEKHKDESAPEGWPINGKVITNRPIQYVLGKHTADREIENVVIESEGD